MAEKNRAFIFWTIVIALVVVFGLLYSLGIFPGSTQGYAIKNYIGQNFTGEVTSAYFETFPAGTNVTLDMKGTIKNMFYNSEEVFLAGNLNVSSNVTLSVKVFNSTGSDMGNPWYGNPVTLQAGNFVYGPITLPKTPGNYVMKLYINGFEEKDLAFYAF
ncbi:MAG: hypothetical protein ABSG05_02655 [Candidatus Pacearchaeota archaeon]|jgi:hypothetical protein